MMTRKLWVAVVLLGVLLFFGLMAGSVVVVAYGDLVLGAGIAAIVAALTTLGLSIVALISVRRPS